MPAFEGAEKMEEADMMRTLSEKRRQSMEKIPPKNREELKAIDEELEEEEKELASWPEHGDVSGSREYVEMEKKHPLLKTLFAYADTVLNLDAEEKEYLYKEFQKPFLKGELRGNPEKMREFEEEYAHPFFAEFFSRAIEVLKLDEAAAKRLDELEELHGKGKLKLEEKEELAMFIEKFCRRLEAESENT